MQHYVCIILVFGQQELIKTEYITESIVILVISFSAILKLTGLLS